MGMQEENKKLAPFSQVVGFLGRCMAMNMSGHHDSRSYHKMDIIDG